MDLLQVDRVSKSLGGNSSVKEVSFHLRKGQKMAIAGATGSGKTTLLKMIAGLLTPDEGFIRFEGSKVQGPLERLIPGHPGIAFLSQHFELWNHYRVEEILSYANDLTEEEAARLYSLGRIDHLLQRRSDQLSGGERQRIALTRLLVKPPRLLLLDEPFSNLDPIHKRILKRVINDIGTALDITCILVSHDPRDLLSWADEVLVLEEGRVCQLDTPERIYRQPVDEYTAGLFGSYNIVSADLAGELGMGGEPGRDRILRPEDLVVNRADDGGRGSGDGTSEVGAREAGRRKSIEGTVTGISFWGGYYELAVVAAGTGLLVRVLTGSFEPGERVWVSWRG